MLAALCIGLTITTSCTDEEMIKMQPEGDAMSFGVSISSEWTAAPDSRATDAATSDTTRFDDSNFLLISTTSQNNDTTLFTRPQSRGTTVTKTNFYDSFGLYGFVYEGPDWGGRRNVKTYFSGNKFTKAADDLWQTDVQRFWPGSSYKMCFFAYAPYENDGTTTISVTDNNIPQLSYEVPSVVTDQKDLLALSQTQVNGDYKANVQLNFKHILTAIRLKAPGIRGTVKKVAFRNVYGSGTYDFDTNLWTPTGERKDFVLERTVEDVLGKPIADKEYTFLMIPQNFDKDCGAAIELTINDEGHEFTISAKLYDYYGRNNWRAGEIKDYQLYESFHGFRAFYVNGEQIKTVLNPNTTHGYTVRLSNTCNVGINNYPIMVRVENWYPSEDYDNTISTATFDITKCKWVKSEEKSVLRQEFNLYIRLAYVGFLDNAPEGKEVHNVPKYMVQYGKETSYTFTIPTEEPTCEGYQFEGWLHFKDGNKYEPGQEVVLTTEQGKLILKASWRKVE